MGNFHTKIQMQLTLGQYWKADLTLGIQRKVDHLNNTALDTASHLHLLCTGSVGSILLVTWRLYDLTGPTTAPFIIKILVTGPLAPLAATYNMMSLYQWVILDNIWDESALAGFDPALDITSVKDIRGLLIS
jgi:hypothetical protein